jgi:peptidoglycan hydrolase-like protein with peptidoglycan-binding domain
VVGQIKSKTATVQSSAATSGTAPPEPPSASGSVDELPKQESGNRFEPGSAHMTYLAPISRAPLPTIDAVPPGLKGGDVGPYVTTIQSALTKWGFESPTTAVMDKQTTKQVKAFQREAGLPVTGTVDAETLKMLQREPGAALTEAHDAASARGADLAAAADAEAKATNTVGYCAKSVGDAFDAVGMHPDRGDAYTYANSLAIRSDMKEIEGLLASELEQLPPGAIVVYGKSETHEHGHVTVVSSEAKDGKRLESSDHQQPLHKVAQSTSYSGDFGAGPEGARFRVFIPLPQTGPAMEAQQ